jgi:AcrR family transcriptional regulator
VAERGYAGTSLGPVIERARVARGTFYVHFPGGLDEGLIVLLDDVLAQTSALAAAQLERHETWQEGLCAAIASVLVYFDAEPEIARVCFVHTSGASSAVVEHRERVVQAFRARIVASIEREGEHVSPVTAESVLASIMGVVRARLVPREQSRLLELLGPLMETVAVPLAASEGIVREQRRRGDGLARAIRAGEADWALPPRMCADTEPGEGQALPAMLANPGARRARECLRHLLEHPDSSNRDVATGIGVAHRSQISKLLSELAAEELVVKRSEGVGKRNAWRLTPQGEQAARILEPRPEPSNKASGLRFLVD